MTQKESSVGTGNESSGRISRRKVLKAAGVATVGVGALAGNASASIEVCFYGCSQVCVDTAGAKAVVVKEDGSPQCEPITEEYQSNRNDRCARGLRDGGVGGTEVYCLSVDDVDATAIVGACNPSDLNGGSCAFIPNTTDDPNVKAKSEACAENYAENFEDGVPTVGGDCPCDC